MQLPPHSFKVRRNLAAHFLLNPTHKPVQAGRVILINVGQSLAAGSPVQALPPGAAHREPGNQSLKVRPITTGASAVGIFRPAINQHRVQVLTVLAAIFINGHIPTPSLVNLPIRWRPSFGNLENIVARMAPGDSSRQMNNEPFDHRRSIIKENPRAVSLLNHIPALRQAQSQRGYTCTRTLAGMREIL